MRFSVTDQRLCCQEEQTFAGITEAFCIPFWKCHGCHFLTLRTTNFYFNSSSNKIHFKVKSNPERNVFFFFYHTLDHMQPVNYTLSLAAYKLQMNDFCTNCTNMVSSGRIWVRAQVGTMLSTVTRARCPWGASWKVMKMQNYNIMYLVLHLWWGRTGKTLGSLRTT